MWIEEEGEDSVEQRRVLTEGEANMRKFPVVCG